MSRGQHSERVERHRRIDQDEVEIAVQASMLEPVVEHGAVGGRFVEEVPMQCGDPIRIREDRHAVEDFAVEPGLVALIGIVAAVASKQHGGATTVVPQTLDDPPDHGGLAGAARRQIAHRDHRAIRPMHPASTVVPAVANTDDAPPSPRGRPGQRLQDGWKRSVHFVFRASVSRRMGSPITVVGSPWHSMGHPSAIRSARLYAPALPRHCPVSR